MPWRNLEAEAVLIGNAPSPQLFAHAADIVVAGAHVSDGNEFKIPLFRRTLSACLAQLTGGAS